MTTRLLIVCLALPILMILAVGTVWADGGPHGGYGPVTDACAGCHRAHTGVGAYLLKTTTTTGLCLTCHNGSGATTNVVDGVAQGTSQGLKAGGFTNAIMDTSFGGAATSLPVSSKHLVDGTAGTMWGNGPIGSGVSVSGTIALDCASCHDPHGNASTTHTPTYRLLKPIPEASGVISPAVGVDVTYTLGVSATYTVGSATNLYWAASGVTWTAAYEAPQKDALSQWCSQCHTRYLAVSGSAQITPTTDSIFTWRHRTTSSSGSTSCVRCHVSHGSTAAMTGLAASEPWPGGSTAPRDGTLLRLDNRGVCEACHHK